MPRRRRSSRGPRRQAEWFDRIVNVNSIGTGTTQVVNLDGNMDVAMKKGATVVRIILDLMAFALTAGTGTVLSVAIAMIEQDASVAGAIPDPEDDDEQPGWLYRTARPVVTSVLNDSSQATRVAVDLHSKRKYRGEDFALQMILENHAGGLSSVNVDGVTRVLMLKP